MIKQKTLSSAQSERFRAISQNLRSEISEVAKDKRLGIDPDTHTLLTEVLALTFNNKPPASITDLQWLAPLGVQYMQALLESQKMPSEMIKKHTDLLSQVSTALLLSVRRAGLSVVRGGS